jgi:N-methylhydantoinase A
MMSQPNGRYVVAADVGGTCTDTVVFSPGQPILIGKALSTPPDFAAGVLASLRAAAEPQGLSCQELLARTDLFIHGSTVVDNTILTREGTPTGLITTQGFEDTLLVTRGAYGRWSGLTEDRIKHPVATDRPEALVAADAIFGVSERLDYKGAVVYELDEAAVERAVLHLVQAKGIEAVAVCFLWSFYNPAHERKVREIIRRLAPHLYVSLSSDIAPAPGEYERTSTTIINAYAGRITSNYLTNLQQQLLSAGYTGPLLVMQGYGGLLPAQEAADRAVGMIECGPAAGVIGAKFLGDLLNDDAVIATDMGGTTAKVGVIQRGQIEYAREPIVDRFHYLAPKIEVVSIGSGGGSIVSIDENTGLPRVGPRSAGARPGPVCYGMGGTEPTLTDVLLLIGYMDPATFLGGTVPLDVHAARRAFKEKIADPLTMTVEEAAIGIYRIACSQVTDLIHEITVERGLDPRDFVLHAFGGTCPLLCGMFGRELQVKRIIVPYTAAVNCAFGLISADIVHEYSTTLTRRVPCAAVEINRIYEPMVAKALEQLRTEGFAGNRVGLEWSIDLRYARQVHEVTTPVRAATPLSEQGVETLLRDFEGIYERKFGKGSAYREAGMEMTTFRLTARGVMTRPELPSFPLAGPAADAAHIGLRPIFVDPDEELSPAHIYDFERLEPGNVVFGPAVVQTPITTIVLQRGQLGKLDAYRNMVIEFQESRA